MSICHMVLLGLRLERSIEAQEWLDRQFHRLLLPVEYFLITFTVPEPLRRWIRSHPKLGYDQFYAASAQALQDLARNPKRLGAQLGFMGVLHTSSRTLISSGREYCFTFRS